MTPTHPQPHLHKRWLWVGISDIRNAINAGKTVTTHQSNISYKGWNGSGYIILDPTTGTGAYLIDGGANGGGITYEIPFYVWIFALSAILFVVSLIVANPVLAIALLAAAILTFSCGLSNYYRDGIYTDWGGFIVSTVLISALALMSVSGAGLPAVILGGSIGATLIGTRFSSRCAGA